MSKTSSHRRNADAVSSWINANLRCAQQTPTPQSPSASPSPLTSPQPTPPISAQQPNETPIAPKTVKTPTTKENCKVTFDHKHLLIEIPNQPQITLALTSEQQAAIDTRLSQESFGKQGPPAQGPAAPSVAKPA